LVRGLLRHLDGVVLSDDLIQKAGRDLDVRGRLVG